MHVELWVGLTLRDIFLSQKNQVDTYAYFKTAHKTG